MRLRFSEEHVRNVPDQPGIFELTRTPQAHAAEQLRACFAECGRLPKYNEPAGRPLRGEGRVLRAG